MAVNKIDGFLSESIESILNQTFSEFEFLILCNGPRRHEIKEYIRSVFLDERIILCCLELEGLAFALNYGINISTTEYCARQDSDDISRPTRLKEQIEFLESNPAYAVVGCKVELIDEESSPLADEFYFFHHHEDIAKILPIYNPLCHPALMFRRESIISAKGYLFGYFSEDHDLFLRLLSLPNCKFHNLDACLFEYRRHGAQLTSKINKKIFSEIAAIHLINIFRRDGWKSALGIAWVLPPVVGLKRWLRSIIRGRRRIK